MNLKEMIQSFLHIRSTHELLFNAVTTFFAFLAGYFQLIVFDNVNLFMAVLLVCLGDWIFGVLLSFSKGKFETRKARKLIYYLTGYWTILFIVLSIEKGHPSAFFLSEAIVMPIIVFQLISMLKNASLLGVLPQGLLLKILQNIDDYKSETINKVNESVVNQEQV